MQTQSAVEGTPADGAGHARLLTAFAVLLAAAALAIAALTGHDAVLDDPLLLGLLILSAFGLDLFDVDLFDRGHISAATVPTLAIAGLFGPLGIVISEVLLALSARVRGSPAADVRFDVGALSLSGIAAAGVLSAGWAEPPLLLLTGVAAGAAYYIVNSVLIASAWRLKEGLSAVDAWRERLAWAAVHYPGYGVVGALTVYGERRLGLSALILVGLPIVLLWLGQRQYVTRSRRSVQELRDLLARNQDLLERVQRSYIQAVTSLVRTIEAKDPYTGGHTERVSEYALRLGADLGLPADELRDMAIGGVIHDIGKVGIRDQVLLKQGGLDDEEWAEMRRHPEIATHILDVLEIPDIAKAMARHHHERFDGGGYPDGLAGEEIPFGARILTVADTLDAMTSDRPYRPAMAFGEALAEIERNAGTQFCPVVVAALRRSSERDPAFWHVAPGLGGHAAGVATPSA